MGHRYFRMAELCSHWSVGFLDYFLVFEHFLSVILHVKLAFLLLSISASRFMCTVSRRPNKGTTQSPVIFQPKPYNHIATSKTQVFPLLLTLPYLCIQKALLYMGFPDKILSLTYFPQNHCPIYHEMTMTFLYCIKRHEARES